MSTWNPKANDIFLRALELSAPGDREEYLSRVCSGDAGLRADVDALIAAGAQAGSFLEFPALAPQLTATVEKPFAVGPGTAIGPYKLLEQIGEGGFGIVYMAEQQQPVRRKVALKVLKPGMDSAQVIARFEAERQALALMDHPNIAKVLDAGTTELGRPYFVMELVRGIPITDYCDASQLVPKERLRLFVSVCQAVQHAHQKGLIHRDIKPSNVLVTEHDGTPVVKVIDFGVAKALGQQLTDKTLFTGFAQMIGTPLYMSPEQAELSSLDVDTRSDVYSLGVLLYELLTGTTPFDKERLKSAAFDEIRRIIREDEPPKPSTRLSDLGKTWKTGGFSRPGQATATTSLTSIAAQRRTEPRKLSQLVRGDLDWIVMKALEKDRNRRYETANGFAADVLHYLADEPVLACPPSASYRVRKFTRRNRGTVLAAGLVLVALLIGMAGTTVGLLQARAERDKVVEAQGKEWQALVAAEENLQTAREAVARMYTRAAEEMNDKPQVEEIRRALLEDALRFYRVFLQKKSTDPAIRFEAALSQRRVGEIYGFLGNVTESLENHQRAAETLTALAPQYANDVTFRDELANAHFQTGYTLLDLLRFDESEASMRQAIALWEPLTKEFPDRPTYLESLARANLVLGQTWQRNQPSRGDSYLARGQELLAKLRRTFPAHELSAGFKYDIKNAEAWRYSVLPHDRATLKQLAKECREQLAAAEAEASQYPGAPKYESEVSNWMWRLGNTLAGLDERAELLDVRVRTLEIRKRLATQHPDAPEFQRGLAWGHYDLGQLLYEGGHPDEAFEHFRTAISLASDLAEKYPDHIRPLQHLAEMLRYCPAPKLRDPLRTLELLRRVREKAGDRVLDDVAMAQIDSGQYREALESCEKFSRTAGQTSLIAYASAVAYWHLGRQTRARELARYVLSELRRQPNTYWYVPECRRRVDEMARLMALDVEEMKASDPEKTLRADIALYRHLAAERPDDVGLLKELARLNTDLWQLLANAGRDEEADQAFDQCLEVQKKLVAAFPFDPDHRYRLSELLLRRGHSFHWTRASRAEQPYRDALAESERLVDDAPDTLSYRLHLANCLRSMAWLLHDIGRIEEGETFIRRALDLAAKLCDEFPADANAKARLAGSHRVAGLIMGAGARLGEAEQEFRQAADLLEQLIPEGNVDLWELAGVYADLARVLARDPGRLADAERARLRESEIVEQLVGRSPDNHSFWSELADCQFHLCEILAAKGQSQDAEKAFNRCLEMRKKLIRDFPNLPVYRHRLATMLMDRGGSLQWSRPHESERMLREAISIAEKLVTEFPDVRDYGTALVNGRQRLVWVLTDVGRSEEAESLGRETIATAEQLLERFPMDREVRHSLASASRAAGLALVANQKLEEGERVYKQSRDTFESLLAEFPNDHYCRWECAHAQHELAILLAKEPTRFEEAEHAYRRGVELVEQMLAQNPALVEHRVQLSLRHRSWAVAMSSIARPRDAEAAFREAVAVMEHLLADSHGQLSSAHRSVLNDSYNSLADLLATTGRNDEADSFRRRVLSQDPTSVDVEGP